jgi:hypothetical protein
MNVEFRFVWVNYQIGIYPVEPWFQTNMRSPMFESRIRYRIRSYAQFAT